MSEATRIKTQKHKFFLRRRVTIIELPGAVEGVEIGNRGLIVKFMQMNPSLSMRNSSKSPFILQDLELSPLGPLFEIKSSQKHIDALEEIPFKRPDEGKMYTTPVSQFSVPSVSFSL